MSERNFLSPKTKSWVQTGVKAGAAGAAATWLKRQGVGFIGKQFLKRAVGGGVGAVAGILLEPSALADGTLPRSMQTKAAVTPPWKPLPQCLSTRPTQGDRIGSASYTVQRGDNLTKIAKRYGTSADALYKANKGIIGQNPNLIRPGQTFKIPGSSPSGLMGTGTGSSLHASPIDRIGSASYTVQRGDNLTKIAKRYGTSADALYKANKGIIGQNPNLIRPGQTFKIPVARPFTPPGSPGQPGYLRQISRGMR